MNKKTTSKLTAATLVAAKRIAKHGMHGLVCAVVAGMMVGRAEAADGTWTNNANGNWSGTGNWLNGIVADGAHFTAIFGNFITADRTITLDAAITIGNITASDTSNNYTISGANILTLDRTDLTKPTINVTSGRTLFISSVIAGNDGLQKIGAGSLELNASNTFTGNADLAAGTIRMSTAVNDTRLFGDSGNTITFTGSVTIQTVADGGYDLPQNITINNGVTGTIRGAFGESVNASGVISGSGSLTIQGDSNGFATTLSNTANTFTGAISFNPNSTTTLNVSSLGSSVNAITMGSGGNNPVFNYTGSAALSRPFAIATTTGGVNIKSAGSGALTASGFSVTGAGAKTITIGGASTALNTIAGNIANNGGNTSLIKADAGNWILTGANTYSGGTTISAGKLIANSANALGTGSVTVSAGTLQIDTADAIADSASLNLPSASTKNITMNVNDTVGKLFLAGVQMPNGTYASSGAGSAWMNSGSGSLLVGAASAQPVYWDLNGATLGAGSAPSGTWDGANTYWNASFDGIGSTTAWTGGQTATFAAGTDATGTYTVTVDGTQDIGGLTFEEGNVTLTNGTALRLVSDSLAYVAGSLTATIATPLSQDATARALTKSGAGTLTLSGDNSYTGVTTLGTGAGRIVVAHNNALGTTAGNTTIVANGANGLVVNSGITTAENITITGSTEAGAYTAAISGGGTLSGTITLGTGTGDIRMGNVTFSGTITQTGTRTLILNGTTINNAITINGATLAITGGTSILKGASGSGIGRTELYQGCVLQLGVTNALNTAHELNIGSYGTEFGTFDLASYSQTIRGLYSSSGSASSKVINSVASTTSTLTVGNSAGADFTFGGTILDNNGTGGTVALVKTGTRTQTISGINTYSGGTRIDNGTLTMGNASALGSTSGQLTVNGGTLNMAGNSLTVGNLTGTGGVISGTSATRTLTIGQGNGTGGNYAGSIQNGGGGTTVLTKTGTGTIILTGINTYSGTTTITNGTLLGEVGGSCSNSAVTVGYTGTLGVKVTDTNKQWTCSSVTVSTGTAAKLNFAFTGVPSTTVAPLKITGAVTFTGTPTVEVDAPALGAGTYPLLVKGDGTALAVPPLSFTSGTLAWSGDNKTLNLIIPPMGTLIQIF